MAAIFCTSCKTSKQPQSISQVEGSVEIKLPFSGKEYQSDSKHFRAMNQGKSPDMATAKKIAMTNALSEIATRIQNTVKQVTDQYTSQRNVGDATSWENKFQEKSRVVVRQVLQDVDVMDEKVFKETDGQYKYYIVLEMEKDQVIKKISSAVSSDAELKVDFDDYMFTKIFNEEMEKFEK